MEKTIFYILINQRLNRQDHLKMRIFFAIDLPENLKKSIKEATSTLKKIYHSKEIQWVPARNLHITLQFLEKIDPNDLAILVEQVHLATKDIQSFDLQIGPLELFVTPFHRRIISLKLSPIDPLLALATAVREGIKATPYPAESRQFKGHITLGKFDFTANKKAYLPDSETPTFEPLPVKEIVLFQSQPTTIGSQYTLLERLPLLL